MSNWDSFGKLATLDFSYGNIAPGVIPQIYANSKNQVEILISVKVIDKANKDKVLSLTPDDFYIREDLNTNDLNTNTEKASLYLCDPTTGERISLPWKLSKIKIKGDYVKAVNHDGHSRTKRDNAATTYIHTYLSSTERKITKNFSIGIKIPGVGEFNTSKNGTNTPNVPKGEKGSPFKAPNSLTITTLNPIDYSFSNNISIDKEFKHYDNLKKVVTDMGYTHPGMLGPLTFRGESSYGYALVKLSNGHQFKEKKVRKNNANLEGTEIICTRGNGEESSADIIWGVGGNNYDFSFLFVEPVRCGLKNGTRLIKVKYNEETGQKIRGYEYRIGQNDYRHQFHSPENFPPINADYILVVICNHRIPPRTTCFFCSKDGWSGWKEGSPSHSSVDVDVTDEFGNEGVISISFKKENWPQITAKGKLD